MTAVDISSVALERARANDTTERVQWLEQDLPAWEPIASSYDFVAAHFVDFASPKREVVFGRLAAAVRPRGKPLVVAHHPSDLQTTAWRWPLSEFYYSANDIATLLEPGNWEIIEAGSFERPAVDPNAPVITVHDAPLWNEPKTASGTVRTPLRYAEVSRYGSERVRGYPRAGGRRRF